ncbi:hypothetical protein EVB81_033 [Rhizobium phage RHph_I46]|nr:hypothetical protein EVB81_033 [Rhizobium phage RHph_I46]QIG70883.1 hypothetical protein EVB92_033 [Rhizobium phage RHph_I9]QIG76222.1 hypothetical protein EVC25_033 [Rhizobium phage RHph_I34]
MKLDAQEHDWKSWLFPKQWKTCIFPVFVHGDFWMVYKPDTTDYVIVSNEEYRPAYETARRNYFANQPSNS